MDAKDIERYLELVGRELERRDQQEPIELMLIGGGYILTQVRGGRTVTQDVDVVWLEPEFWAGLRELRRFEMAVHYIAITEGLDPKWLNTDPHEFVMAAVDMPELKLWKQFGPLMIYIPPKDLILALKLMAAREKDEGDIELLRKQLRIDTRRKAQNLIDKYINEFVQHAYHAAQKLDRIFSGSKR